MSDSAERSSTTGRTRGQPRLVSQARNIVMNVYKFFKRQGGYDHIDEVDIKTAEATQVKVRTIRTIKNQSRSSLDGVIKSPAPRP